MNTKKDLGNYPTPVGARAIYERVVQDRLRKTEETLASKQKEYATDNPFHNFEKAARVNGETPMKALWGMATKHLVSIIDMIDQVRTPDIRMVDEKFQDMINYLIILEAMYHYNNEMQHGDRTNTENFLDRFSVHPDTH